MPRMLRYALLGLMLMLALGLFAACGGGDDDDDGSSSAPAATETPATTVNVSLEDFTLTPDSPSAPQGEITFAAQNLGVTPHEFLVVRTELAADALPSEGAEVDESQLDIVLRIDDIAMGQSAADTAQLEAGNYVLICNVAGHYALGMSASFTVE